MGRTDGMSSSDEVIEPVADVHSAITRPVDNLPPVGGRISEEPAPKAGYRIAHYHVIRRLGQGGMGVVYEAHDETLDRRIALKLLRREMGQQHGERLVREAQALARLSHPNVVGVYEVGIHEGRAFIAMELVSGTTLLDWQQTDRSWREVVDVYIQAGRGLAAAHAEGLVHRDFKPSNCIIDDAGRLRVLDFGLASDVQTLQRAAEARKGTKVDEHEPSLDMDRSYSALARPITSDGTVMGTLPYMAPEQLGEGPIDAKSDQFSFCVALFEALYGGRPRTDRKASSLYESVPGAKAGRPPKGVPRALQRIVERGLRDDAKARWPAMDALLMLLERRRNAWRFRWGAVALLGVGGILGAVAVITTEGREPSVPCQHAQGRLDGVWDDHSRRSVRAALLGTGTAYAPDTWSAVERRLDRYAAAWIAMHTEACEATRVHGEQSEGILDLRMRCLEGRRVALEQSMALLAEADVQVTSQAVGVVADLPPLSRCADVEALSAEIAPPDDPAVRERVGPLRAELRRAHTLRTSGKYHESLAAVDPVLAEAGTLGYDALLAEALQERGELNHAAGRYEEGQADLRLAYVVALRSGHRDVAVNASTELTFVSGALLGKAELGRWMAESAEALAQHRAPGGMMEARALVRIGQLHGKHGDYETAADRYGRALALLEKIPESDPLERVYALDGLRAVLVSQARYEQAEASAREALAIVQQELGARHPDLVVQQAHLAAVLVARGEFDEAGGVLRAALDVAEQALPSDHPTVALVRSNLGATLLYQGDEEQAELQLRRALEIWETVHEPEHDQVANAQANLGVILRSLGRTEEAEEHYRSALASYITAYEDPDHPTIAITRLNLGKLLRVQGRLEEASTLYGLALASFERKHGPEHPRVASTLDSIGAVRFEQGRLPEALESHQRALAILEGVPETGAVRPGLARSTWALGRTLHRLDRLDEAREQLTRSLDILDRGHARPKAWARSEVALARVLWDMGDEVESVRLARSAKGRMAAEGDGGKVLRDEIEAWIDSHAPRRD